MRPGLNRLRERYSYRSVSRLGADSLNPWIRKSASIGGWLFEGEHEFLWELASESGSGNILEIGTWLGKSACILAGACREVAPRTRLVCIDPFDLSGASGQADAQQRVLPGSKETLTRFAANAHRLGFGQWVNPIVALSQDALPLLKPESFRMIFIDGTHDFDHLSRDVALSVPLLSSGGVLAMHDMAGTTWPGLVDFEDYLSENYRNLRKIEQRNTILAFRKT